MPGLFTKLSLPATLIAVLLAFALSGCGESEKEKATAQVCSARKDINKQVQTLSELQLSTSLLTDAKDSLEAIVSDLGTIKEAQPKLKLAEDKRVESAVSTFEKEVTSIVSGLVTNQSLSKAEAELKASLKKFASNFGEALNSINCG